MDLHLYPTTLSRDRAMRQATRAHGVLFDQRYFTYAEISERLFRSESLPGRLSEPAIQTVFVRHSLATTLGETPSPGLVAEFRDVIAELKGAGLAVEDFATSLERLDPEVSATSRQALHRVLDVWRGYQGALIQAGLVDRGDQDLALLFRLQQHRTAETAPALLQGVRRIVAHDLYHLPLVHYALISLLIKLADDGGILQHFSSGLNIDAVTFAEFTWQRFVADESLAALVLPEFARPRVRGGSLEALSERLFSRGLVREPVAPDGALRVIAAPGRAREVEALARHIRGILDRGDAPERIAIVVRNLDQYGDLLESICRRYGIPLWFRRGLPLFHVPLTKTLFSLLELADSSYPRAALLKLLTSAYMRPDGPWPNDVVGLVNGAGYLDRQHAPLRTQLEALARRRQPGEEEQQRIMALADWVETLQRALDDLVESARPFLAYLEGLKSLLSGLGVFRAMGMHPDLPLHVIQRDREALQAVFDTLWTGAEALHLLGDAPLAFQEFRLLAIDLLREVALEQPRQMEGAVCVLGVQDTLGLDFDHVCLPGLADTEFPRHYSEHPVLDDSGRHACNPAVRTVLSEKFAGILDRRLLGKILLTTIDKAREEPLFFYLALEAANQTCLLSYPTRTANGEAIFPSVFVDEVRRHFDAGEAPASSLESLPALPSVPLASGCLEPGELLRRAAIAWGGSVGGGDGPDLADLDDMLRRHGVPVERLRALAAIEAERKQYLIKPSLAPGRDPAPYGDIGRHIDLRRRFLDPQRSWSPTMLEDAAACPFVFFARHALQLASRTEPDYDVSPATLGELAHSILSEFFHTDPPSQVATAVQRMRAIADQVLTRRRGDPGLGHPGFWHVRKAELLAALDDLATYVVTHRSEDHHTQYHEQDLTGVVTCGSCSVALKGRVDRVVMHQGATGIDAVLVQDFKYSGSVQRYREALAADALGHSSFQLPVYLYLTLQRLAQEGHRLAPDADLRLQYWLLKDSKDKVLDAQVSHTFFAPDQIGGLLHGLQAVIEPALAGRFAPQPLDARHTCSYCSYAALCRYWSSGAGVESGRDTALVDEET